MVAADGAARKDSRVCSLQEALAAVEPGDVITLLPGVYRERLVFRRSGTADAPIVIRAQRPGKAVITGADVVTGWERDDREGRVWKKHGLQLRLPRALDKGLLAGRSEQVFVDGILLRQVLHRDQMISGTFCYDEEADVLYIAPHVFTGEQRSGSMVFDSGAITGNQAWEVRRDDPETAWQFLLAPFRPEEHVIEVTTRSNIVSLGQEDEDVRVAHVRLEGVRVRGSADKPQRSMVTLTGEHVVMEGCMLEYGAARGFTAKGSDITVRRCELRHNGQMGFAAIRSTRFTMDECRVSYNNYKHSSFVCFENGGCKITRSRECMLRRVVCVGNDGPGLWFDIDNEDNVIERCWCEGNSGPGIMYEISRTGVIRNNICVRNGFQYKKDVTFNAAHTSVGHVEPVYGQGILIQLSSNCRVYNNTCVGNRRVGIELRHHPYTPERYPLRDNEVLNNIVVDNGWDNIMVTPRCRVKNREEEVGNNRLDYNLYHMSDVLEQFHGDLLAYARFGKNFYAGSWSLEEWRCYVEGDQHSIQWDPYFVAPDERNYRLEAWSPARGRGCVIEDLTEDFYGQPRPAGKAPCIGAVEYREEKNQ